MTRRIAFAGCNMPFWFDLAERLERQHGFTVCYWLGSAAYLQDVGARFPRAAVHFSTQARLGQLPEGLDGVAMAPLGADVLSAMTPFEGVALKMIERFDLCDYFLYDERVRQYHRILACVIAVLEASRPDVVVFPTSPHAVSDYVLYGLCRVRGIRTLMLERTNLPGRLFTLDRFEDGSPDLRRAYARRRRDRGRSPIVLAPDLEDHLARLAGSYEEAMPPRLRFKRDRAVTRIPVGADERPPGALGRAVAAAARAGRVVASILRDGAPDAIGKRKGHAYEKTRMGRLEFLSFRLDVRAKRRRLLACYQRLSRAPDLERPFVFAALQCQPERQACPNGGAFIHQGIMVDLLSKTVPTGWHVYVKEHLSQFNDYQTPERSRSETFYEDMAALPNVDLVPMGTTSFDLIDKARAVATVSGTVGWESVVRGTPTLLFAHGWYQGCEGVFDASTAATCGDALDAIAEGFRPDPELVRLFVKVLDEIAIHAYVDPVMEKLVGIGRADNAVVVGDALLARLAEETGSAGPT